MLSAPAIYGPEWPAVRVLDAADAEWICRICRDALMAEFGPLRRAASIRSHSGIIGIDVSHGDSINVTYTFDEQSVRAGEQITITVPVRTDGSGCSIELQREAIA